MAIPIPRLPWESENKKSNKRKYLYITLDKLDNVN